MCGSGSNNNNNNNIGTLFKSIPTLLTSVTTTATAAATAFLGLTRTQSSTYERRSIIDQRVARLMSEFWSTFAKYGDPNGMPCENGYVEGTRPVDSPWWPRLRGELYS